MTQLRHPRMLTLSMAAPPISPHVDAPDVPNTSLTTLERTELCAYCDWPDICQADRTCWIDEARQPWNREIIRPPARFEWTRETVIGELQAFRDRTGRQPTTYDLSKKGGSLPSQRVCLRLFGSWKLAQIAAGMTPNKRNGRRRGA